MNIKGGNLPLVPRLRLGMHGGRLCLPDPRNPVLSGQSPETSSSQAEPGNEGKTRESRFCRGAPVCAPKLRQTRRSAPTVAGRMRRAKRIALLAQELE